MVRHRKPTGKPYPVNHTHTHTQPTPAPPFPIEGELIRYCKCVLEGWVRDHVPQPHVPPPRWSQEDTHDGLHASSCAQVFVAVCPTHAF